MENPQEFRAFWSVIPATVLDDMQLQANAKILYGVLSSLMRREGYCWPSNAQLAAAMHCSEDVIRRWLAALQHDGHIQVRVVPNRKTGGSIRYISPVVAAPVILDEDEGYRDEQPGTYRDKNPGVPGQTSRSLYKDGYKKDNKKKKEKEKANAIFAIDKLIKIANNKREYPDFKNKHGNKAKHGWYRYDTHFGIPVYDKNGMLERYNVFGARILIRCDENGDLYLYDIVRIKKETSRPLS